MTDAPKTVYVDFFDEINMSKVKTIMAFISDVINKQSPNTIYILFSSPGGNVESGITLYNFLRSLPVEIIMHNTGSTDSIANVIFLAANTRFASVHSSFMFHGVSFTFAASTSLNRGQLSENLSGLDASETKIRGVITERTKLTEEEVKGLFAQGETKNPTFALSKGIISEIKDPLIPKGTIILSANFL